MVSIFELETSDVRSLQEAAALALRTKTQPPKEIHAPQQKAEPAPAPVPAAATEQQNAKKSVWACLFDEISAVEIERLLKQNDADEIFAWCTRFYENFHCCEVGCSLLMERTENAYVQKHRNEKDKTAAFYRFFARILSYIELLQTQNSEIDYDRLQLNYRVRKIVNLQSDASDTSHYHYFMACKLIAKYLLEHKQYSQAIPYFLEALEAAQIVTGSDRLIQLEKRFVLMDLHVAYWCINDLSNAQKYLLLFIKEQEKDRNTIYRHLLKDDYKMAVHFFESTGQAAKARKYQQKLKRLTK